MFFFASLLDFISFPPVLIGLFVFIGQMVNKKRLVDAILSALTTSLGFLLIIAGVVFLNGPVDEFTKLYQKGYQLNALVPNDDVFNSQLLANFQEVSQMGSLIFVLSILMNLYYAYLSRFKNIYLAGHLILYMSMAFSATLRVSGFHYYDNTGDFILALITAGFLNGAYLTVFPELTLRHVRMLTGEQTLSIGHTGSLFYVGAGYLGELIHKLVKKPIKSTEDFKSAGFLKLFNNLFFSIFIVSFLLFITAYIPLGIKFANGSLKTSYASGDYQIILNALHGKTWGSRMIINALIFAAGIDVIIVGVKYILKEVVEAFRGLSNKLIKNVRSALDAVITFTYSPNAVKFGFISSLLGGAVVAVILFGLHASGLKAVPLILPAVVPSFFLGATAAVFGNIKGGYVGAIISGFLVGVISGLISVFFDVFNLVGLNPQSYFHHNSLANLSSAQLATLTQGVKGTIWASSDFSLVGLIGGIGFISTPGNKVLITLIAIAVFLLLSIDGVVTKIKSYRAQIAAYKLSLAD